MNNPVFAFDVDGTLTDSRQLIDPEFAEQFKKFISINRVFLVTGSDYPKTLEQIGEEILNSVEAVYCCCGNTEYRQGVLVNQNDFKLNLEMKWYFEELLAKSKFEPKTGNHIEERIGMVNFSVLGRNATLAERQKYVEWDKLTKEREDLKERIGLRYLNIDVTMGGETGLDIYPTGKDKSQVAKLIPPFIYFGDRTDQGGNDYSIAIEAEKYFQVAGWKETQQILKEFYGL